MRASKLLAQRRFIEGRNMITANEYTLRRNKLLNTLDDNSVTILFAGVGKKKSGDENYEFVPNKNFYYLTGIKQENSILKGITISGGEPLCKENVKEVCEFIKDVKKEKKNFAVTKQEGDLNPLRTTANKVTVDGIVTAGVANNIKIDIGTEPKDCIEIVIVNKEEREAVQAYYDKYYKGDAIVKVVEKPTVKVEAHESTGLTGNSLVYSREDYGNALIARYN